MARLLRLRLALVALVVVVPTVAGASGTTNASGPLTGITAISAGGLHTCAVLSSTEARCWGDNQSRQLGDGSTVIDSIVPVAVLSAPGGAPLTGIVAISAGRDYTCVVLASTEARCWGANSGGQLGVDDSRPQSIPVTVRASVSGEPLTGISSISAGRSHTCAVLLNGEARCWGVGGVGQLGDNTAGFSRVAVTVVANSTGAPLTGVTSIAVGEYHTCALLSSGTARCWGSNLHGQLGTWNKTPPRRTARSGPNLTGITGISAGAEHTCAVLSSGQARCWGGNFQGQLADGTAKKIRRGPVAVVSAPGQAALTGIADIYAGVVSTCVLMSIGQASCTDEGGSHNLIEVGAPLTDITDLSTGANRCALLSNGEGRCWGDNLHGQLGDGTRNPSSSPVVVMA